jgi:hypothetical protein
MAYANAYAPLSRRNEEKAEELFKQQIETPDAPTVAPEEKGFLSKVAPMLVGAVANAFLPGSGAIASGVTSAALGGDGAQLNSPEAAKSAGKFTTWYGDKMSKDKQMADIPMEEIAGNDYNQGAGNNASAEGAAAMVAKLKQEEELLKRAPLSFKGGLMQ